MATHPKLDNNKTPIKTIHRTINTRPEDMEDNNNHTMVEILELLLGLAQQQQVCQRARRD